MLLGRMNIDETFALSRLRLAKGAWTVVGDSSDVEADLLQFAQFHEWSERKWL